MTLEQSLIVVQDVRLFSRCFNCIGIATCVEREKKDIEKEVPCTSFSVYAEENQLPETILATSAAKSSSLF